MKRRSFILILFPLLFLLGLFSLAHTTKVKQMLHYHLGLNSIIELYKLGFIFPPEGEDIFFTGDGVRIAGTLFTTGQINAPGIIFLHGSSVEARKLGFCLLVCQQLANKGFHVLSMDMRGFGESEEPEVINSVESWQSKGDVQKAVDFLMANANVDTNALYIVGHSAGANQAIIAGIHDPRIKKIIAIGPSRRVKERVLSDNAQNRQYLIDRFAHDRMLNESLTWDTYRQIAINAMIDTHIPSYQTEGHKPIFLIDGGLEGQADQEFLQNVYRQLSHPKKYLTIRGSNHYSNIKELGPFIFYHRQVVDELINSITTWLRHRI